MELKVKPKQLSVNPLKVSQPLGGVLALQGIYRALPILHGAQGCAAFTKALMTRHFREPVALQTSALHEMNVIFGAGKSMTEALDTVIRKHKPDLIAVLSTSLTEVAGDDTVGELKAYKKDRNLKDTMIVPALIPDFEGSLESGYNKTVAAVVRGIIDDMKDSLPAKRVKNRVNLLAGSHLTPGDVMELKEMISSFGFEVIAIPDLSTSLGGHLLTGHTPLSRGGVPLDYLKQIVTSEFTIVVGSGLEPTAKLLEESARIPYQLFPSLLGLEASDAFFSFLQARSRQPVPVRYRWQREYLLDSMLDAHFVYGGKRFVTALEPDHLASVALWLKEMGAVPAGLVAASSSPVLESIKEQVIVGDFGDLEDLARHGADLWISNSHGVQGAERCKIPYVPCGFPLFDLFGSALVTSVGYRGTTEMVNRIGNVLLEGERSVHS